MGTLFEGWNEPLKVSIVQTSLILGDPEITLQRSLDLMDRERREGVPDLIVMPESFISGFIYDDVQGTARTSKQSLPILQEKAMEVHASLMFSLPWEEGGMVYNRLFWIGDDGSIKGTYDKTHLFSRSGEDRHFSRGMDLKIFIVKGVPIGVLTCYELRYPELARALAVNGAGAIVYIGEWPASRVHQWSFMLHARAIENQIYTVGANLCGRHGKTIMGGNSAIVEPYGLTMAALSDSEGACRAELDRDRLLRFRKMIPQESDRREVGPVRTEPPS